MNVAELIAELEKWPADAVVECFQYGDIDYLPVRALEELSNGDLVLIWT